VGRSIGVRAIFDYSLEIGNLNRARFEKVKKSEKSINFDVHKLVSWYVK